MKAVYKIDLAIVLVSMIILVGAVGYVQPRVIAPLDDYETSETEILFSIDKAETLLIDDNIDFTTPEEYNILDGLKINLNPGTYYWKANGIMDSEIRTLTIRSEVSLELKEVREGYAVYNAGNVRLNVDIYNGTELVDKVKLGVNEEVEVTGDKLVGGSYEN